MWYIQHINALLTFLGLIFDIIGAWLVAWEVVRQYRGNRYSPLPIQKINMDAEEQDGLIKDHPLYTFYEMKKYRRMFCGLIFLTLGFILQIIPNFRQLLAP